MSKIVSGDYIPAPKKTNHIVNVHNKGLEALGGLTLLGLRKSPWLLTPLSLFMLSKQQLPEVVNNVTVVERVAIKEIPKPKQKTTSVAKAPVKKDHPVVTNEPPVQTASIGKPFWDTSVGAVFDQVVDPSTGDVTSPTEGVTLKPDVRPVDDTVLPQVASVLPPKNDYGNYIFKVDTKKLINENPDYTSYILSVEKEKGFEPGSLVTLTVIESRLCELNVNNGQGYEGCTQMGKAEFKKYGSKYGNDRKDVWASQLGAADLNITYQLFVDNKVDTTDTRLLNNTVLKIYGGHQQGQGGLSKIIQLAQGQELDSLDTNEIISNMANNIYPESFRKQFVSYGGFKYRSKGKPKYKNGWVLKPGVTRMQMVNLWLDLYNHDTDKIHKEVLETIKELKLSSDKTMVLTLTGLY